MIRARAYAMLGKLALLGQDLAFSALTLPTANRLEINAKPLRGL
jgi:hypothetical protein